MSQRSFAWIAALCLTLLAGFARAQTLLIEEFPYPHGFGSESQRPPEFLRGVAYSPDGKTLVSAGQIGFAFWDAETGKRLPGLPIEDANGTGVAYSPDGKSLFTADADGNLLRWNVQQKRVTFRFPKVHATIERMTLSHDGNTLATTDGQSTAFWDARTGQILHGWNGFPSISGGGNPYRMIGGAGDIWSYNPYRVQPTGPNRFHLTLSPDGRWCAAHLPSSVMHLRSTTKQTTLPRQSWPENMLVAFDFSPDGKTHALAFRNGDIQIADSATLQSLRAFTGPTPDSEVRFSPDGSILIGHHPEAGILAAYDPANGRKFWHHQQAPLWRSTALTFSADGKRLLTGDSDQRLRLYDLANGKLLRTIALPAKSEAKEAAKPIRPIDDPLPERVRLRLGAAHLWHSSPLLTGFFLNGGKQLLTFPQHDSELAMPSVLDTTTGKLVRRLEELSRAKSYRNHVVPLPDRRHLLLTMDRQLYWWDLETNKVVKEYQFTSHITAVAVSRDGKRFAVAGSAEAYCPQAIHVWDADGSSMRSMQGHDSLITTLAFSPDGTKLFSASLRQQIYVQNRHEQLDGLITEWDVATGRSLRSRTHQGEALALSPDGNIWVMRHAGDHSQLHLLDWRRQEMFATVLAAFQAFLFSPDGSILATGGPANVVTLWNPLDGKMIRKFQGHAEQGTVPLCFSDDGKILATKEQTPRNDGGSIRLWNVETGEEVCRNPYHRGPVHHVVYSPDGRFIVSAGEDRRLLWWNAKTGALVDAAEGHESPITHLRFAADGRTLVSACSKAILVWDAATRKIIARPKAEEGAIHAVSLTSAGKELRTAHADAAIRTWDIATGKLKAKFHIGGEIDFGSELVFLSMATFSPDGTHVAVQRNGATEVLLYHVGSQKLSRCFSFGPPPDAEGTRGHYTFSSLVFSPDGRYLAGSVTEQIFWRARYNNGQPQATIFIWEVAGGEKALSIKEVGHPVGTLAFSPDGRSLLHGLQGIATSSRNAYYSDLSEFVGFSNEAVAILRDLTAGRELTHFTGTGPARVCVTTGWELPSLPRGILQLPSGVTFSPDGRSLVTVDANRSLIVWDAQAFSPPKQKPAALDAGEFEEAWAALGKIDSAKAHAAIWRLTRDADGTLAFLRAKLSAPRVPTELRLHHLVNALDNVPFVARAQAMRELEEYAELAEPALRQAHLNEKNPERKRRLEGLLDHLADEFQPDWLRQKRAIETLERLDHTGARQLLEELSRGPALARITLEARAALTRSLASRGP